MSLLPDLERLTESVRSRNAKAMPQSGVLQQLLSRLDDALLTFASIRFDPEQSDRHVAAILESGLGALPPARNVFRRLRQSVPHLTAEFRKHGLVFFNTGDVRVFERVAGVVVQFRGDNFAPK